MSAQQKPSEVCIGLSVEGDLMRLATVGRFGQKLTVLNLGTLNLPHHEMAYAGEGELMDGGDKGKDPFDDMEGLGGNISTPDYSEVHDFLQAHYVKGATVAISFGEPTVRTDILDHDPKEKGPTIVNKILAEIERTHNATVPKDMIGYSILKENKVLAAALLETPPLLGTLTQPLGADGKPTKVPVVNTNDIALANITRAHFRFRDNEIVHLVYVGKDETRFYVLKGGDLMFIAPPIQQGGSREFVAMLNNRIELAAELAGYPKADKVVLAGAAEAIGLRDEILANNPYVVFHSLSKLRVSHGRGEQFEDLHDFAIPISMAWQKLLPKTEQFYKINLVPSRIKQEQNTLQMAWHGWLLMFLTLLSAVGLGYLGIERQETINEANEQLGFERAEIERQREIVDQINVLDARSTDIVAAVTTLDTLLINQELWTETLDSLSKATARIGGIWVSEFKPDPEGGSMVIGFSRTRQAIPNFSNAIGEARMREVLVETISDNKVFRYDMNLVQPQEYPYAGSPAAQWHDTVKTYIGAVDGGLPGNTGGVE